MRGNGLVESVNEIVKGGSGGGMAPRNQSFSACHRSQTLSQIFYFAQLHITGNLNLTITYLKQYGCHRLHAGLFSAFSQIKVLKKPNYKSHKRILSKKMTFSPPHSHLFGLSFLNKSLLYLEEVGSRGLGPQKPNHMHFHKCSSAPQH